MFVGQKMDQTPTLQFSWQVLWREVALGQVADGVDNHFITAILEHRAMRCFAAETVMQFSNHEGKSVVLPGNIATLRIIGQRSQRLFKSSKPAKCLFR